MMVSSEKKTSSTAAVATDRFTWVHTNIQRERLGVVSSTRKTVKVHLTS